MYEQQMNMFQEGGVMLEDEGGAVEETSGNEVPLGGVKEGVADDQEANLSAGEMVLSEDVVRYHGVEKIMSLRDEAKMGYHKMEAMGQLGNSDEATIPTEAIFNPGGMPFSVVDLEYIEMGDDDDEAAVMAMADNEDEPIKAQAGTLVPVQQPAASFSRINPSTGLPEITAAPATSISQVLQPGTAAPITTGSTLTPTTLSSLTPTSTPISAPDRPATQQPAPLTQLPSAQQFLGGVQSTNFFINEIGQVIQVPVVNGRQIFDEPEGFQPFDPSNPVPFDPDLEDDTVTTTDEQPQQRRRTVTDREEGGQPDVGPGGADTPTGAPAPGVETDPQQKGLGLGSLDSVDNAANAIGALGKDATRSQIESIAQTFGVTLGDVLSHGLLDPKNIANIISPTFSIFSHIATKNQRARTQAAFDAAAQDALDDPDKAAAFSQAAEKSHGELSGQAAASAAADAAAAAASFGAAAASGGHGEHGAPDTSGGDSFGADDGPDGMWNTGGLISPRLHRKRMKKNNRKGLAAPK